MAPYPRLDRTNGIVFDRWPLLVLLALSSIWLPTLARGFCEDDFQLVPISLVNFLHNPFPMGKELEIARARPLWMLSYALLPSNAVVQHSANLLLYVGSIIVMWRLCAVMSLGSWGTFFALSSFFHPAFLWDVTWITQRNDLLMILFFLGAITANHTSWKLTSIILSSAAKTPFILQDIIFAAGFFRQRQFAAATITVACLLVFGLAGYLTYYQVSAGEDTLANASVTAPLSGLLRILKVIEGTFYVFAPIPMFTVGYWGLLVALACFVIIWVILLSPLKITLQALRNNIWLLAMTICMCIPFAFNSEVRVAGPAAVMLFFNMASVVKFNSLKKFAAVALLFLNISGIVLNYGLYRSDQYDITGAPQARQSEPVGVYGGWRDQLRYRVLRSSEPTR